MITNESINELSHTLWAMAQGELSIEDATNLMDIEISNWIATELIKLRNEFLKE